MMKGFIEDVPKEIEESAKIDGCTELGSMMRIVLPCSLPGMIATSILSAIFSWNELFFAVALTGQKTKTLPVALYGYVSVHQIDWGALGASGLVTAIPVVLFAILVQRYVVKGLTFGAVKG
jgi:multiple sugar transport system permease protein